jgi:hypothetical protein
MDVFFVIVVVMVVRSLACAIDTLSLLLHVFFFSVQLAYPHTRMFGLTSMFLGVGVVIIAAV